MVDVAVFLGADREIATAQLFAALQFEIALANVSINRQLYEIISSLTH